MVWQLTVRRSRESGNPGVVGVNVGYVSRPPDSERYRLLSLAKLTEHMYYYKHMAHRSPYHSSQNHKATEATRCLMPENQKKTPCSKLPKRNPDPKPNSDTSPTSDRQIQRPEMTGNGREIEFSKRNSDTTSASDGQIQRPEMTGNGREIEFSKLTFRQQAALPRMARAAHKPVPEPHSIARRVASRGFRHLDFMALHKYVQRCRNENTLPAPQGIVRNLLPRAAPSGILDAALRWDAPPSPARSRPAVGSRRPRWQLSVRHYRESGNPRVVDVNVGSASRPPNSERYRQMAGSFQSRARGGKWQRVADGIL